MKVLFYKEDSPEPFRIQYDPNNVRVKDDDTVTVVSSGEIFKIIKKELEIVYINGYEHFIYNIWVK